MFCEQAKYKWDPTNSHPDQWLPELEKIQQEARDKSQFQGLPNKQDYLDQQKVKDMYANGVHNENFLRYMSRKPFNGFWEEFGWTGIPTYQDFFTHTKEPFEVYWAICHFFGMPGWIKPFVGHKEYDPTCRLGAYDRKSIKASIDAYGTLKIASELSAFINYSSARYQEVIKQMQDENKARVEEHMSKESENSLPWKNIKDQQLCALLPAHFKPETSRGKDKGKLYAKPTKKGAWYAVGASTYPKRMTKNIQKFTIWDSLGKSSTKFWSKGKDGKPKSPYRNAEAEEYLNGRMNTVKKMIKRGKLTIPGLTDFDKEFIACHFNLCHVRTIQHIDHYHMYFEFASSETAVPETTADQSDHDCDEKTAEIPPDDLRRRLLEGSKKQGA